METLRNNIRDFVVSEDGPTAVEYAVMLALIILVCMAGIRSLGSRVAGRFNAIAVGLAP